jgi:hypothetical protein
LARKNPKCLISTGVFGLYWTSLNFQMGRRPSHKGSYALHTKESRQFYSQKYRRFLFATLQREMTKLSGLRLVFLQISPQKPIIPCAFKKYALNPYTPFLPVILAHFMEFPCLAPKSSL